MYKFFFFFFFADGNLLQNRQAVQTNLLPYFLSDLFIISTLGVGGFGRVELVKLWFPHHLSSVIQIKVRNRDILGSKSQSGQNLFLYSFRK